MSKNPEIKLGSPIYDRIATARMSDHERRAALHAMQTAEDLVDALTWVARKIEHLGSRLFFKPSLKH